MSGQWEVVGRNKKDKVPLTNKKPAKPDKKATNITKVEDVLPSSQVKNLYLTNGKSNKENKKPQEKEKPKEAAKKPAAKKTEKVQESNKVKTHKSIESALNSIQAADLKSALETSMVKFPDAPLVWLKEVSAILNAKIVVDLSDPIFTNRPDGYPLSAVPAGIKQVMEKAVESAGKSTAQLFFDNSLTAMANDLSKGHPALGHKLWIQFLAINNPQIAVANLDKHVVLRTSYQNRQPIGLSILWALGQGGVKDFHTGLKVFKNFMMPLLEMKNYSRYVVQYLAQLLKRHESVTLSKENYMFLFDLCHSKHSLSNEAAQQLSGLNKDLKNIVLSKGSEKKCSNFFEPLLVKLVDSANNTTKNDIAGTLVSLLSKDSTCYSTWVQLYIKNLQQSSNLLKYINEHWKKSSPQLDIKRLRETVKTFATTNSELSISPKKDPALKETITVCKVLLDKMTVSKTFPWKSLVFVILLSASTFLIYDIKKHGAWQKSQSVRTLKDIGVWEYGEKTWDKANQGLNWTKQRIEEYAPGYIDSASGYVEPYVELSRDLGLVLYNLGDTYKQYVIEKYPVVVEFVDKHAPGLLESLQKNMKAITTRGQELFTQGYEYVTTQVFVGELAPENMQKVVWNAFNTTQQFATEYYHWLYEKIETTMNGK